jgi:hypothetical protein
MVAPVAPVLLFERYYDMDTEVTRADSLRRHVDIEAPKLSRDDSVRSRLMATPGYIAASAHVTDDKFYYVRQFSDAPDKKSFFGQKLFTKAHDALIGRLRTDATYYRHEYKVRGQKLKELRDEVDVLRHALSLASDEIRDAKRAFANVSRFTNETTKRLSRMDDVD